eukprot:7655414-Pyramimonas_sp.AAC.1
MSIGGPAAATAPQHGRADLRQHPHFDARRPSHRRLRDAAQCRAADLRGAQRRRQQPAQRGGTRGLL